MSPAPEIDYCPTHYVPVTYQGCATVGLQRVVATVRVGGRLYCRECAAWLLDGFGGVR